jgi:FtsH-binding integral membrane protein
MSNMSNMNYMSYNSRFYSNHAGDRKGSDEIVVHKPSVLSNGSGGRKEKLEAGIKMSEIGLKNFLSRVYLFTGGGIAASLGLSHVITSHNLLADLSVLPIIGGGLMLGLGGGLIVDKSKYQIHQKEHIISGEKYAYSYSTNSPARLFGFGCTVVGMTLIVSPSISVANMISPDILLSATIVSGMLFGGSIIAARTCPSRSLLSWQVPLMGGLYGLIGVGILGIGAHLLMGPNPISSLLFAVDTYGGIVLFMGITALDTQIAVERYEKGDPDHLGCTIQLYLDFMNILIRIINIMSKNKK